MSTEYLKLKGAWNPPPCISLLADVSLSQAWQMFISLGKFPTHIMFSGRAQDQQKKKKKDNKYMHPELDSKQK